MSGPHVKVALCLPSGDDCKMSFALSLFQLLRFPRVQVGERQVEIEYSLRNSRSSNLARSRNDLAQGALDAGADWALFVDSDMSFPAETAAHLLAVALIEHAPIVACTAATRAEGHVSRDNAYVRCADGWRPVITAETDGVHPVDRVGGAIMLIAAEVFRRLPIPWFLFPWLPDHQIVSSEDYYFCDAARAANFRILVDFSLSKRIGHAGNFTFTLDEAADLDAVRSRGDDAELERTHAVLARLRA